MPRPTETWTKTHKEARSQTPQTPGYGSGHSNRPQSKQAPTDSQVNYYDLRGPRGTQLPVLRQQSASKPHVPTPLPHTPKDFLWRDPISPAPTPRSQDRERGTEAQPRLGAVWCPTTIRPGAESETAGCFSTRNRWRLGSELGSPFPQEGLALSRTPEAHHGPHVAP